MLFIVEFKSKSLNNFSNKWLHRLHILQRLSFKYFFKILGTANQRLQPLEKFSIKKGYHHTVHAGSFNDTSNTGEWQKEVYQFSAHFMKQYNYQVVIDVGCGSAYKLIKYLDQFDTTGIEVAATYQWLKERYPLRKWLQIEQMHENLKTDLVICSDVIEHIADPDGLLQFIQSVHSKHIIISTPERDAVAGKNDYGPPENTTHYREWNAKEFYKYISDWFDIEEQQVFAGRSSSQVIVCRLKIT